MTTEEIEKQIFEKMRAKDFGESMCNETKRNVLRWVMQQLQEKTRWIPVEEKLPEVRGTPYCIAIKYESVASEEEMIGTLYVYDQSDVNYLLLEGITHWKEIE